VKRGLGFVQRKANDYLAKELVTSETIS